MITAGFSRADASGWVADYGTRRTLEAIVWHDMEGYLPGAIARWNGGFAGAHLCVLKNGTVVLTCKIQDVAYHAGTDNSQFGGTYGRSLFWRSHNINPHSIGVELEGFVDARDGGYTEAQIQACVRIARWARVQLGVQHAHTFDQVAGHHLHGELSTSRSDPGPLFPIARILEESR